MQQERKMKNERRLKGYAKADKPNKFFEYLNGLKTEDGELTPRYPNGNSLIEFEKAISCLPQLRTKNTENTKWIFRGPSNVPGRTRALALVPNSPNNNTWIAGSVGGGIWKTTNGGTDWTNITPDLINLSTTSIVISPSNPNIVYAGTGEIYAGFGGVDGMGILKSTDGGNSFQLIPSTANNEDFRNTNRIIVSPQNENIILAATTNAFWNQVGNEISKIMRSEDGGQTWTKVYTSNKNIDHIVAAPSNFNVQYASINEGSIIKSIDAGKTWSVKTDGFISSGRAELAVSPTNANKVYASVEGSLSGKGSDLFYTSNGGENWYVALNPTISYDFLGGQGWFDNTVLVHPYNDNIVYIGGVNIFKFEIINSSPAEVGNSKILRATEEGTQDFLSLVNFTDASFLFGNIAIQTSDGVGLTGSDFVSVELRFGLNKTQKAHRFLVPSGQTSGVAYSNYSYQNYVDVPFEVWDVTNNKQLMVSFRDQDRNGAFNLNNSIDSDYSNAREYIFIHKIDYDKDIPSSLVTKNAGNIQKCMYFFWPIAAEGLVWNPDLLPESKFSIIWGKNFGIRKTSKVVTDAYKQFSGPNQFVQVTGETQLTGLHPDHHNLMAIKVNEVAKTFKIVNANDGGIYSSNTSTTPGESDNSWTFSGGGMSTTQFYGVDKKPGAEEYIGGTQDNGTWKSPPFADANTNWSRMLGGDGFQVVWNKGNDQQIIASIYENIIYRSLNGGGTWSNNVFGLTDTGKRAPFITRIANNPTDPNTLFMVGASGVWKSINFGRNWTKTTINSNSWTSSAFNNVHVSQANPNIVWAGSGMSEIRALFLSTNKGQTFTKVPNAASMGAISGMASHPTKDSVFYALFSLYQKPKIYKTEDLGQTWEDITGFNGNSPSTNGFPDVAVYSLLVRPDSTNVIWAGTEIGLMISRDEGETWQLNSSANELPYASIWDMKVVDNQVILATHGRGIYTYNLEGYIDPIPTPIILNTNIKEVKVFPNPTQSTINITYQVEKPVEIEFAVYDIQGNQKILLSKEKKLNGNYTKSINVSALSSGTYVILIRNSTNLQVVFQERFVKI